jgi:uncharacterized membrane protein YesL
MYEIVLINKEVTWMWWNFSFIWLDQTYMYTMPRFIHFYCMSLHIWLDQTYMYTMPRFIHFYCMSLHIWLDQTYMYTMPRFIRFYCMSLHIWLDQTYMYTMPRFIHFYCMSLHNYAYIMGISNNENCDIESLEHVIWELKLRTSKF